MRSERLYLLLAELKPFLLTVITNMSGLIPVFLLYAFSLYFLGLPLFLFFFYMSNLTFVLFFYSSDLKAEYLFLASPG